MNITGFHHLASTCFFYKCIRNFIVIFLFFSVLFFLKGCEEESAASFQNQEKQLEVVTQVKVIRAEKTDIRWPIEVLGTCIPKHESIVSAKTASTIDNLLVEEGDKVEAGELLAISDTREMQANRDQAAANLKAAKAALDMALRGYKKEEVKQLASQLEAARATYQRVLKDVARQERLHESGMIRDADYEDFQTQLRIAKADLDRASAAWQSLEKGFRQEEIQQAEAKVDAARAALSLADVHVDYCSINSPISGRVGKRMVDAGEWVTPGKPLFQIQSLNPIWIEAHVPEVNISKLRSGLKAQIRVQPYPNALFEGKIQVIGTSLDLSIRTLPVKINVPNEEERLVPGLFADVTLYPEPTPSLIIPKNAIFLEGKNEIVPIVKDGKLQRVYVETGNRYHDIVSILSGLQAGDQVVLTEVGGLPDGTPVQVLEVTGGLSKYLQNINPQ